MTWVEIFAVFLVSHLAGDYLLQTEWQAAHKRGGLGREPLARRALFAHVATYGLAFVPAVVWLATDIGLGAVGIWALIVLPHYLQDDGRAVTAYIATVKHAPGVMSGGLFAAVDQSMHVVALFGAALLASA